VVRVGKFGPYLQRGEVRANVPENIAPDELDVERAVELLEAPSGDRVLGTDPDSGLPVLLRDGRFGPYVQLGKADELEGKPKTQSLLRDMEPEKVVLEQALQLLSLPRLVGKDEEGVEILAFNGRYGPYIARGKDRRSLEAQHNLFTLDMAEALKLLAQPRRRGGRGAAKPPLRELGPDPVSGDEITLREGRFGPYVTDGTTNASLRTGDDPTTLTPERAHELLQLRRERGPSKKKRRKKKVTKKKATKKKATKKKAAAKKASTKQPSEGD